MKKLRDIDTVYQTAFAKAFAFLFMTFGMVGFALYGFWGAVAGAVLGFCTAPLVMKIADGFGNIAASFYKGRRGTWTVRELSEGELNKVRHLKMKQNFEDALQTVNSVLLKDPDYPDALLIKAQILREGFNNRAAALSTLNRILALVADEDAPVHRWAVSLKDEITRAESDSEALPTDE